MYSDFEIENVFSARIGIAHETPAQMQGDEIRLIWPDGVSHSLHHKERTMQVKIVQRINAKKKQEKESRRMV